MRYPALTPPETRRDVTDEFGGYDRRPGAGEDRFADMKNLSSDAFPAVSPRKPRGLRAESKAVNDAQALLSGERLVYAAGNRLFVDDEPVMDLPAAGEKRLVAMGAYVLVFPDRLYYNTADPADRGSMEAAFTLTGEARYTLCREDGEDFPAAPVRQDAPPDDPENLDLWLDTSGSPPVLKQYSAASGIWESVPTACVRIEATGIGAGFAAGDGVRIGGIPESAGQLAEFNGTDVLLKHVSPDAVVIAGLIDGETAQTGGLTLSRRLPALDHVFECGNRLWGCRYGENADGAFVNEICCSKLGDFKNWSVFEGLSTDSYAASVGSDGPFTAAAAYRGNPLFFKADCLHRVFGAYPATFQIQHSPGFPGVQRGCEKSLAIVNGRLYYRSDAGICAYDGASAAPVSAPLGPTRYFDAAAGARGGKYYVSMTDAAGAPAMFVYDTERGLWHKEDATRAGCFAVSGGALWFIENGRIRSVCGEGLPDEARVQWMLETTDLGLSGPDRKTVTRVDLRMTLPPGSSARISINHDGEPGWTHIATRAGGGPAAFSLPVTPRRCDRFRLRIEGRGEFRLLSVAKTVEVGSEL